MCRVFSISGKEIVREPAYCANRGYVDEIVSFPEIRKYVVAFAGCAYQNPVSICPHHHMMIPRIIKG